MHYLMASGHNYINFKLMGIGGKDNVAFIAHAQPLIETKSYINVFSQVMKMNNEFSGETARLRSLTRVPMYGYEMKVLTEWFHLFAYIIATWIMLYLFIQFHGDPQNLIIYWRKCISIHWLSASYFPFWFPLWLLLPCGYNTTHWRRRDNKSRKPMALLGAKEHGPVIAENNMLEWIMITRLNLICLFMSHFFFFYFSLILIAWPVFAWISELGSFFFCFFL